METISFMKIVRNVHDTWLATCSSIAEAAKRNLLAVEMKRKGNKVGVDKDQERLASLVTPYTHDQLPDCVHDTLLGAFIEYSTKGVNMELFTFSSETDSVSISQMNLPATDLREPINME